MLTSQLTLERSENRERFETEIIAHRDALLRFALRLTGARADAEDLVSDTILRALDRRHQYRSGGNMRPWLCTMLYHLFVSLRRKLRREVDLEGNGADRPACMVAGRPDPEGHFYDSLIDERITRALNDLPHHYRLAVVLSDMRDLDYTEIAELLGVPVGTVKSRIYRGRRTLRTKLARYAAEIGYTSVPVAA